MSDKSDSATKLFSGSSHAAAYAKARPNTPQALVDYIIKFIHQKMTPPLSLAVDVGCGSGQGTKVFAPYFQQIIGIDVSEAQIKEANKSETLTNIQYKLGTSSRIPVANCSAQLITAACAAHWFDLPEFYQEVERILVPGGVVAIFSYNLPKFAECKKKDELTEILHELNDVLKGYSHDRCKLIHENYKDLHLPYSGEIREIIADCIHLTIEEFSSYIQTWSAYHTLLNSDKAKAESCISRFEERLKATLGPDDKVLPVVFEYYLIMARKPI